MTSLRFIEIPMYFEDQLRHSASQTEQPQNTYPLHHEKSIAVLGRPQSLGNYSKSSIGKYRFILMILFL